MSAVYGGELYRLVEKSLYVHVKDALTDLGWFNPSDAFQNWRFLDYRISDREEISQNTATLSLETSSFEPYEMGTNSVSYERYAYIDVYPQNASIGKHFLGDIESILLGARPDIGLESTSFSVINWSVSDSALLFNAQIEDPVEGSPRNYTKPYFRDWRTIGFKVRYIPYA